MYAFGHRRGSEIKQSIFCSTRRILISLSFDWHPKERTFTTCMVVIIPEWIALIHWNHSTSGPYTRGTLQAEGDSLTCLAVRPSVSTTAGAYVAVH